jgi:hypothetical protein
MDYFVRNMDHMEHRELMKMLKAKQRYLTMNQIPEVPAIFDNGDQVGIFYHVPTPHHKTGIIIQDDERGVTIAAPNQEKYRASPHQLFHLPKH